MRKVDIDSWNRKELFEFFSKMSHPFYSVTFKVDVTKLYEYVKCRGLSFYYALVYLCTEAINDTEAFLYVLREGEVYRIDRREPSFTDLKPGAEQFHIVTMSAENTLEDFCHTAKKKSSEQEGFIAEEEETDELIYFSCLPWVELTALTNERDFCVDDSIPRIAWGKYRDENGRKTLQMSVELNHRFADGVHVGRFYEALCERIEKLGRADRLL